MKRQRKRLRKARKKQSDQKDGTCKKIYPIFAKQPANPAPMKADNDTSPLDCSSPSDQADSFLSASMSDNTGLPKTNQLKIKNKLTSAHHHVWGTTCLQEDQKLLAAHPQFRATPPEPNGTTSNRRIRDQDNIDKQPAFAVKGQDLS
ncbi:hypothetical protein NDU88_003471 [Pleurodeles waltl]|uniref:Uncharacterized protein n=1 Tax=Pleurodeles waltl TaxID=8319 RepID=A0AAV7MVQ1_PLEWA|nr:hypothetical protein NDU88_003471 [Pleurodeles waltl]